MSSGGHRAPKGSQEIADTRMVAPSCALVYAAGPRRGANHGSTRKPRSRQ